MDTVISAIELLRPWIDCQFGDEVPDAEERLETFKAILPGRAPDDYAATLLWLKRATGLKENEIEAIEPPRPRERGIFEYMGPNPPIDTLYGLQASHTNLFEAWRQLGWRMPAGLVPIGEDGSGNQICLDVSETGNGRIFHWFHVGDPGPDDENGRPGWGNTFLLASSFTDLCRRLRPASPLPSTGPVGKICFVRP